MIRICQISDVHIRNVVRHEEYRHVFDKLYDHLHNLKPNLIVTCGDLAHLKTQISPEYVELTSEFLKNLADIAPTKLILGNHDKNYKNINRLDAVSPIVKALNHPNLEIYLKSGEYKFNERITLNIMNIFDKENWCPISNHKKINIALYHGSITGCKNDFGWEMQNAENDIAIFNGFDYVLMGDIHKTNQQASVQRTEEIEINEEDIENMSKFGWKIVKD